MTKSFKVLFLLTLALSLLLASCQRPATPTTQSPTQAAPAATEAAPPTKAPTATKAPTSTKPPTATLAPTSTSEPLVQATATLRSLPDAAPLQEGWWRTAVFYEIFVRSFEDSDGDGIGDFNGITQRLDYLNDGDPSTTTDLGVTGLWLMPIFPSPSYHGYDVTDYLAANPQYGTLDDFKHLLSEAHRRGIGVILDFVINHTSTQHAWFQAAQDPASPLRDYFIWSESNPGYLGPWGQQVWYAGDSGYYYAIFWDQMPDLNFRNPAVTQEIFNAASYWLKEVGVDGFRIDAAQHLIEEGQVQANSEATHAWFKEFRKAYKADNPIAMVVGEVWSTSDETVKYLQGDELDLTFHFDLAAAWVDGIGLGIPDEINAIYRQELAANPQLLYGTFLTNHDMNRAMHVFYRDAAKARLAATLLLTSPGVPFLYYGEEIGMSGAKPDEDIRRPMQWSDAENAGFSRATPWNEPFMDYTTVNVAAEDADPASLLNHYRRLVHLRQELPALNSGELIPVESRNGRIVAFLRQSGESCYLVVANLGNSPASGLALKAAASGLAGTLTPQMVLGEGTPSSPVLDASGGFEGYEPLAEIPALSAVVIQLR